MRPGDGDATRCREPLRCSRRDDASAAICSAAMNSGSLAFAVTASSARRAAPTELSRCSVAAACSTACRDGGDASCGTAVSCSVARCDSCHDSVGASRRFSRSFVGLRRIGGGGGTSSFRQSAKQRSQPSGVFFAPASCGTGGGARTVGAICATVRGVKRGARLLPARQLRVVGTPVTPVEDIFFGRLGDGRTAASRHAPRPRAARDETLPSSQTKIYDAAAILQLLRGRRRNFPCPPNSPASSRSSPPTTTRSCRRSPSAATSARSRRSRRRCSTYCRRGRRPTWRRASSPTR